MPPATPHSSSNRLLEVTDLRVEFRTPAGVVHAVNGVSFAVDRGETLAIVGESGSGKTVSALSVLGLIPRPPGKIVSGKALYDGRDLLALSPEELRHVRGAEIAMIFQDPLTALNPVQRVGSQIVEMIRAHEDVSRGAARARAVELLRVVGIPNPDQRLDAYPHEFSGGMRQRAMIAMALSLRPSILIADEPTTALDVTIQAQILELLTALQEELGMAMIIITHDLGVVARIADEILVMYAGRMAERGTPEQIFHRPQHPYTLGLLGSIPRLDEEVHDRLVNIPGLPPSLRNIPSGCPFHPRCPFVFDRCPQDPRPELELRGEHEDACFLPYEDKEAARNRLLKVQS